MLSVCQSCSKFSKKLNFNVHTVFSKYFDSIQSTTVSYYLLYHKRQTLSLYLTALINVNKE